MTQIVCMFIIGLYIVYCTYDCKKSARKIAQRSIHIADKQRPDNSETSNIIPINESARIVHQTVQLVLEKYEVEQMKLSASAQIVRLHRIDRKLSDHARRLVAIRRERNENRDNFWRVK